jgi:hypothetical protein
VGVSSSRQRTETCEGEQVVLPKEAKGIAADNRTYSRSVRTKGEFQAVQRRRDTKPCLMMNLPSERRDPRQRADNGIVRQARGIAKYVKSRDGLKSMVGRHKELSSDVRGARDSGDV